MNKILKLFLQTLLLALCSPESVAKSETFGSFGESCNQTRKCDPDSFLKCKQGVCRCVRPDAMLFLNVTRKCYIKSGERCAGNDIAHEFECVPKSTCASDGYCTCQANHMEANDGYCVRKRYFLDICEHAKQCRENQRLECINGKCTCDRTKRLTYNVSQGKCATMAGYSPATDNDQSCVPNASYNYRDKKCRCASGYNETSDGICVAPHGEQCAVYAKLCARDMICRNDKCECHFSGQIYDNGVCYSRVNQPCGTNVREIHILEEFGTLKNISFPCVVNSKCEPRADNENILECQCNQGYVGVNGHCHLSHGAECGIGAGMQGICDQSRNMECINGYCQCAVNKLQYFDEKLETCRGLIGAPCGQYEGFCTDGAACVILDRFKMGTSAKYTCACMQNYRLTEQRKCVEIVNNKS